MYYILSEERQREEQWSAQSIAKTKTKNQKLFVLHYSYGINTLILLVKNMVRVIQQASL